MNGEKLLEKISAHDALTINHIDGPYHDNDSLRALILNRGLSRED